MKRIHAGVVLTILLVGMPGLLAACGAGSQSPAELLRKGSELTKQASEALAAGQAEEAAQLFLQAEEAYEDALAQEPDRETEVDVRANLGVVYYQLGRLDDAIETYEAAQELAPEDADLYSNLGAAYVQKALDAEQKQLGQEVVAGFWDEARQAYERAVELQPDLAQAYFGLGVIHLKGGNREAAIAAFEAFQQHDTGEDQRATEDAAQYLEQLQAAP